MTKPHVRGPEKLDPWFRPMLVAASAVVVSIRAVFDWNPAVAIAATATVVVIGATIGVVLGRRRRRAQRTFQRELEAQRSTEPVYRPRSRS